LGFFKNWLKSRYRRMKKYHGGRIERESFMLHASNTSIKEPGPFLLFLITSPDSNVFDSWPNRKFWLSRQQQPILFIEAVVLITWYSYAAVHIILNPFPKWRWFGFVFQMKIGSKIDMSSPNKKYVHIVLFYLRPAVWCGPKNWKVTIYTLCTRYAY
jgi:hypothetical protein